jgi:hypothetical protein
LFSGVRSNKKKYDDYDPRGPDARVNLPVALIGREAWPVSMDLDVPVAQWVAEAESDPQSRPARTAAGPSVEEPYYFEAPQPYVRPPEPRHYSRWRQPPPGGPRYGWQD